MRCAKRIESLDSPLHQSGSAFTERLQTFLTYKHTIGKAAQLEATVSSQIKTKIEISRQPVSTELKAEP